jgi:lipopolysaccharide/colanic/teichoic acid biosynthesis glycosyltransferase
MLRRPTTTDFKPRRLPWKRSLQSLLTPEQMSIAVQRETARADRNGAQFALVLFRARNKDQQSLSTVRLAITILRRVRATDDVGWYDDRHLAALLPDTAPAGAWRFAEQVCTLVSAKAPRPMCSVYSYPTLWFKGDHTPESLIQNEEADDFSEAGPVGTRSGLENVIPFFLENVNGNRQDQPAPLVHAVESLLLKPLPWWKRAIDILGAAVGMVLLSPLMAVTALAVKATSTGPAIFTQNRAGLGGKSFRIYKFRTMCVDAEAKQAELMRFSEQDGPAFKIKDDPRVTTVGKFLRKTSIDELPQLLNVLKGDMTLVGPRPLPMHESAACEGWHRRRLDVTPGLTCIWQVKGRSQVSFSEWVRMDVAYIRRRTLFNDVRIILQTIPAVLFRRGAR